MKILLIYPGTMGAPFLEMPLQLVYLADPLQRAGYEVEIFDCRIKNYKKIKNENWLFVGVTVITGLPIKYALKVSKHIKALNPKIPVIWGGVHPTLLPEETLETSGGCVDYVVCGHADSTIVYIARGIEKGTLDKKIILCNQSNISMDDISIDLPYGLLDLKRYRTAVFPIHTSRGCPYQCAFCYNTSYYGNCRWQSKSAQRVLAEIDYIYKLYKPKELSFCSEDEFFISKQRVLDICNGLIERNYNIKWNAFCRYNNFEKFTSEEIQLIEKSGCILLGLIVENNSRVRNDIINKNITDEQIYKVTSCIAKTNIQQSVGFMSCVPGETKKDLLEVFEIIDKLYKINPKVHVNYIVMYSPFPGTPLFNIVINDYGYKPPMSLDEWSKFKLFRIDGVTWQSKEYVKMCKTLSLISRFPFYKKEFKLSSVNEVIESSRFSSLPIKILYYLFTKIAMWRWKHKYFRYQIEFDILAKVLEYTRGYV